MNYQYQIEEHIKRIYANGEKPSAEIVGDYGKDADKKIEELENTVSELKISLETYGQQMNMAAQVIKQLTEENGRNKS